MDPITYNQLRATPYFLNFIFNGKMYMVFRKQAIAGTGGVFFLQTRTHATELFHTISRAISTELGGPFTVDIIENPTLTDGAALTSFNMDRRSTKTSQTLWFTDPTAITGGTIIDQQFIPSATNTTTVFSASDNLERILKTGTNYVMKITNDGAAATIATRIIYYESGN